MLKTSASFVLGSSKSSTCPRGYASGFDSPTALLDGFFEHPAERIPVIQNMQISQVQACPQRFSVASYWVVEVDDCAHRNPIVAERWSGVEPPRVAVRSMTWLLFHDPPRTLL